MKKGSVKKLSLNKETLMDLGVTPLTAAQAQQVKGGSANRNCTTHRPPGKGEDTLGN